MSIINKLQQLVDQRNILKAGIDARMHLQRIRNEVVKTNALLQQIVNDGHVQSLDIELRNPTQAAYIALKDLETVLTTGDIGILLEDLE